MLRDFGKNGTLSLVILYIGILFLLAAPRAFADTDDLTADIQSYYMFPNITCQNYAIGIFADVDNADNGGTYGIYDTMLVMININGELYGMVEMPSNKQIFFTFPETNCGEPDCTIGNTCDKGRFVMRFVDMTAAGFVPDNSSTWTYKTIPSLTFYMSHDLCWDYDDPRYDTVDPYMQARAYKVVNNAIPANLIDVNATQTDVLTYDFTDADDGIAEVYITTDYCENTLDDLILRSGAPTHNTPEGINVTVLVSDDVTVTFDQVTEAGNTTVTESVTTDHPVPGDFSVCDPPVYYNIETTATELGDIEVCIHYADTCDESDLRLLHYDEGLWVDVTETVDTVSNIVCGTVSHLSEFVVATAVEEAICSETEGDLDGDCDVDMDDVNIFRSVLGTSAGEPAYNVCADIDGDGRITMNDYRFMRTLFTGPGPGCP